MAGRSWPDGIFECAVAWSASNYVAKLSADVLSTENLESLGHIFDFATLPVRLEGWHVRRCLPDVSAA
jgi:hypothetical protein